eukprot:5119068-Ditylum_brightwellii.AAC.1
MMIGNDHHYLVSWNNESRSDSLVPRHHVIEYDVGCSLIRHFGHEAAMDGSSMQNYKANVV